MSSTILRLDFVEVDNAVSGERLRTFRSGAIVLYKSRTRGGRGSGYLFIHARYDGVLWGVVSEGRCHGMPSSLPYARIQRPACSLAWDKQAGEYPCSPPLHARCLMAAVTAVGSARPTRSVVVARSSFTGSNGFGLWRGPPHCGARREVGAIPSSPGTESRSAPHNM
ncbi:hypothetical protein ON010_g7510 [Phytophthora cinnamomi]|nr:hypothetical protein ON010_g7510 [Phytophthora cinnamomi]